MADIFRNDSIFEDEELAMKYERLYLDASEDEVGGLFHRTI